MPSLADCLRKSRLPSGVKTHLRQRARDSDAVKAVRGYLAVVDGNIEALGEGAQLESKRVLAIASSARKTGKARRAQDGKPEILSAAGQIETSKAARRRLAKPQVPNGIPSPTSIAAKQPWEMRAHEYANQLVEASDFTTRFSRGQQRELLEARKHPGAFAGVNVNIAETGTIPGRANHGHFNAVQKALRAGLPVPPSVLADYPDLAAKANEPTRAEPTEAEAPAAEAARKAKVAGARPGFASLDPLTKTVEAGLKAGKWTIDQTRAAARWLWMGQGSAVSLSQARTSLLARFGDGIKRFIGRIYRVYRAGMRGVGDFFAGPGGTSKLATKPAPAANTRKLLKVVRSTKPVRRTFEAMKLQERAKRAAIMAKAQQEIGGREALWRSLTAQKGEFERPDQDLEIVGDQFSKAEIDSFDDQIWTHPLLGAPQERMGVSNSLRKLLDYGTLPTDGEIAKFEIVFGRKFAQMLLAKRHGLLQRAFWVTLDIANIPRTLKASWDLSATLRQGGPLSMSYPGIASGAFVDQLRAFGSESYAQKVDTTIRADEDYQLAQEAGLFLPHISGTISLSAREEMFQATIIQRIPVLRVAVRPSERSFVTYLNQLRFRVFKLISAELKRQGKSPSTDMREYKRWAKTINAGTGRGNIDFGDFNVALNALFFAPRLQVGRFEYPGRLALQLTRPLAIKVAARQIVASLAFPLIILGFLAMWSEWDDEFDAKVEYDPRSTDFGRVQIGDRTAVDVMYGYGSNSRFVVQMMLGVRKQRDTGRITNASRMFIAWYWLKGKFAPVPSTITHIVEGKRFGGKPLTVGGVAADLTVPITFEQLFEAVDEHGRDGLWLMGPEIVGLGVYIRPEDERNARRKERKARAPRKARAGR